ncbi:hypothetical protein SUGI_0828260 [Cryptomeria japonica]|nr:hypothetical protein SUGI_0828260 [Cryptomeria japonica]
MVPGGHTANEVLLCTAYKGPDEMDYTWSDPIHRRFSKETNVKRIFCMIYGFCKQLRFRDVALGRFSMTQSHDTILSYLFNNIDGEGMNCIFNLDKEVDVRDGVGSQGKVKTSLEEVKVERINGGKRKADN